MRKRAERRAPAVLDEVVEGFRRAGCEVERAGPFSARARPATAPPLRLGIVPTARRIFGGTYALEVSSEEPVLPATRGVNARGRGVVRWQGIAFRAKRGDDLGRELAARLAADPRLAGALAKLHFDRVRVEPDGRPVIRHMGGALVWILLPPMIRTIPLVDEQVRATIAAMEAFAEAGAREDGG